MYPITFLTSYLLLVFCHFGATEPPPSHGYGPPSPVEFGSNEIGSHEQYSAPADFGSYNSFSSGSPSSYSAPSSAYKSGPPSFSPHYSSGGPKYGGGLGSKGGVSSSYVSIVHGAGSANGPGKHRPATYSSKGPAPVINSYNPPSFGGNAAAFTDVKSFGGASPYSSGGSPYSGGASPYSNGEAFGSNTYSKFGGNPAAYSAGGASYESFSPGPSADYNKGYESGGVSDEVASYSSGGPSYATFTGSSKLSYTPSFSQGSRGNAFSTSNVNVFGGKPSGHGNFHPPSYTSNVKPSSGAKVYSRYSAPSSFGPSSSSYSSPSLGSGESGYSSRALKAGHGIENSEDFASSEDSNVFSGGFGDGAGFKVQSSYSTG